MIFLSVSENVLLFVTGAGLLQAITLAALLCFHPKSNKPSSLFLAAYILFMSIPMTMPVIQYIFSWQAMLLADPFTFLIGPFLYLYVCSLKRKVSWQKAWPHFILFAVSMLADGWNFVTVLRLYPTSTQIPKDLPGTIVFNIVIGIRIIQLVVYYFLSRRELVSYQRSISQLFSETSRINLRWVRWLINGFIILVIALIIDYPLVLILPEQTNLLILINTTMITPYIYIATFKGLVQPALWQVHPEIEKNEIEEIVVENERTGFIKTVSNNSLSIANKEADKIVGMALKIGDMMEQEKIYMEPELTLQQLADRLQLPSYQVSQAINEGMKKTFYDLINGYRVEEAKRLLTHPKNKNYTILSIGFEAGFNSKTTFNTVFKKYTGQTPTDFRNKQEEASLPTMI